MSSPGSEEPLSNISDTSFVILGHGSIPNQGNDESPQENSNSESLINSKSSNTCVDFKLSSDDGKCFSKCSYTEESIQGKLNELIKENYHLKETLSQNNLAIKTQLDTFFMWQQEVLKTHETHKQKFLETKDLVLKLRMENLGLKKQLEESSQGFSVISVGDSYSQINKKLEDSGAVKERIKELENICDGLVSKNENLNIEKQKLVEELGDAKNEILKLKKELEEVAVENLFLKQRTENLQKNSNESNCYKSLPNGEARAQISNLFRQLEEEKGKVLKLKEALEKAKSNSAEPSDPKISTMEELSQCIDKLDDMNNSLDLQKQRISGFHSWVTLAKENFKENQRDEQVDCNLMCDIKEFKSYMNLEESAFKEKQESVEVLKKQFIRLLDDYKTLQQQLNLLQAESQNIERYKKEIVSLSAELQTKDKELISQQQECSRLTEEIKKLNFENDEKVSALQKDYSDLKEEMKKFDLEWCEKVSVLQIQAELYKSDFNCEREARQNVIKEKEELLERIELLQKLLENSDKRPGQPPGEVLFKCPKCLISFSNTKNLEEHVELCLDTFMYP